MVSWKSAYERLVSNPDFAMLFGRSYRQDAFRPYTFCLRFDSLTPALLGTSAAPNTGDLATTIASGAAPTTQNIVPGTLQQKQIVFPEGAVILGMTSSAVLPQRTQLSGVPGSTFRSSPENPGSGGRDLFLLQIDYTSGDGITAGNPIAETSLNPNSISNASPPGLTEALLGNGEFDEGLSREVWIVPGQGLTFGVRSMVLPTVVPAAGNLLPNLTVHLALSTMIPGKMKLNPKAAA